ncbi:MAG TPA: hypothetical protein VER17_08170 [Tepidisphaeraceae bacterium]|nr:hypothetical protein [Tepidisphaeraceae bacterium]
MATIAAVPVQEHSQLTAGQALRIAWVSWLALMSVPALMFLFVMWHLLDNEAAVADTAMAQRWFLACMIYLALAVPASFFWRSHEFKCYWDGCVVSPKNYLKGMLIVWLAIEVGGLMALAGCLATNSLLPNLLPAMVAFILFTPFWPSGRAMTHPVGNDDDFEVYEEPR